jgi:hypothetical protein
LELPDAKDRHVLAAAIKAGAQVIVTRNISHFPQKILSEFDIEAQHPDDFILYQKDENLPAVIEQLRNCRMVPKKPPLSMDEFIEKFRKARSPTNAAPGGGKARPTVLGSSCARLSSGKASYGASAVSLP